MQQLVISFDVGVFAVSSRNSSVKWQVKLAKDYFAS
jgi:hypothetical protein